MPVVSCSQIMPDTLDSGNIAFSSIKPRRRPYSIQTSIAHPTQRRGVWDGSGLLLAAHSHDVLIGTDSDHSICIHVYQNTSTFMDRLWSLDRQLSAV
jgi:hypothetical protein